MNALAREAPLTAQPLPDEASLIDLQWFVAITERHREEWACENLAAQYGYYPWLPMAVVMGRDRRTHRPAQRLVPLFPGYVLLGIEFHIGFGAVRSTKGVQHLICSAEGYPLQLPISELQRLRAYLEMDGGAVDMRPKEAPRYKSGDRVKVIEGPFAGQFGLCTRSDGKKTEVRVTLFGGQTSAQFTDKQLERIVNPNSGMRATG